VAIDMTGIGFIGFGKMAQAIVKGMLFSKKYSSKKISAYDVDVKTLVLGCKKYKIGKENSNQNILNKKRIIILAVKPQNLSEVLESLKTNITSNHLIITIVAGVSINKIQQLLGIKCSVVRVMPNTPALIGEGAAGYAFSREVKAKDKILTQNILATICKIMINVPESEINKVTALSGSGPAYVFYFAEAMLEAARQMKFDLKEAKKLIAQTFIGSAMLLIKSEEGPEVLRRNVTSKGGTTESAITTMEAKAVKDSFIKAIILAKERADELGK